MMNNYFTCKFVGIIFFVLCQTYTVAIAQLSIHNDAFCYSDNTLVYVEDDINLEDTNSKFYLRNTAQLIQGTGITGNTGNGELSIYQTGTSDQYSYNYWCSPVGLPNATNGNSNFRVNLIDESTGLISSTGANFTQSLNGSTSPLTISNRWLYTFETSDQFSDWAFQGSTGDIAPGLGFTMKGTSAAANQLYDYRGKPNSGTITNNVASGVFTLIGNPYPSSVDAVRFIHYPANVSAITGVLYLWDQDLTPQTHILRDYLGGYATYTVNNDGSLETFLPATFNSYNSDGTLNTTGSNSTSGRNFGRYIPISQGFMVEGIPGTTGVVTMRNSFRAFERETAVNGRFFKVNHKKSSKNQQGSPFKAIPSDFKRFRLNIDFNDLYTRQLVQTFHETKTTNGYDIGYDIKQGSTTSSDVYWNAEDGDNKFIAQAQPFNAGTQELSLAFTLQESQSIRIRLLDVQNFSEGQEIYFKDTFNNTYTNLQSNAANINLEAGDYTSRFKIVFTKAKVLNTNPTTFDDVIIYHNDRAQALSIINYNFNIKQLNLYDTQGREIFVKRNVSKRDTHTISTCKLSVGAYIVTLTGANNTTQTYKIAIHK